MRQISHSDNHFIDVDCSQNFNKCLIGRNQDTCMWVKIHGRFYSRSKKSHVSSFDGDNVSLFPHGTRVVGSYREKKNLFLANASCVSYRGVTT